MKLAKPNLGVVVIAVPERKEKVGRLIQKLGISKNRVVWDINYQGHVPNWWRAVAVAGADGSSHALILEDDAQPCRDFLPAVQKLIERYPERIISFFSVRHTGAANGVLLLQPHYRAFNDLAVVYPVGWLKSLQRDFEKRRKELEVTKWQVSYGADEMRINLRPKQQVWNTVPSLVQHGSPNESVLGHRFGRAIASNFIGLNASALSLDWGKV